MKTIYHYTDSSGRSYFTLREARQDLRSRLREDPDSVLPFPLRKGKYIKRSYFKLLSECKTIEICNYYGI